MYPTHGNIMCFLLGQCQDGDGFPDCTSDEGPWGYGTVGIVVGTKYSLNKFSASYKGGTDEATYVAGSAYYFSDSNSLDKRDTTNGRGCHGNQDFGCAGTGDDVTCITKEEYQCK